MPKFDFQKSDTKILVWYAQADWTLGVKSVLDSLRENYLPREENESFQVCSRLQSLSLFGYGLWVKWRNFNGETEEGFVYHWKKERDCVSVNQLRKFGFINVPYIDIVQVALRMPSEKDYGI